MSYGQVYETIIVKANDGSIYHLTREGCNNDTAGREPNDWRGYFYANEEAFIKEAKRWENCHEDIIRIGGKIKPLSAYTTYLLNKLKRAISIEQLEQQYYINFWEIKGIQIISPIDRYMSLEEWAEEWRDLFYKYKTISYRRDIDTLKQTTENALKMFTCKQTNENIELFMAKLKRR